MARTGVIILLLSLASATVFGLNDTDPLCEILNANKSSSSAFNLTVSPDTLQDNTTYNVHLEGAGNFTVILQALSSSGTVGNWSAGNISCNGSPLFLDAFQNGKPLEAQWKSPENVISVNITAHIHNDTDTFIVSRTLNKVIENGNTTTIAPASNSSTAHNSTIATATTITATTPVKTTSAGSAVQTSLVTVIQILGLLLTSKYLC